MLYWFRDGSLRVKMAALLVVASLLPLVVAAFEAKVLVAVAIGLAALLAGALFAGIILDPIRALSTATESMANGDFAARVPVLARRDELGRLSASFNAMAGRIESQATDLVERKRADLVLSEHEEDLATTLYSIGDGVIATDAAALVTKMNRVAERLTGWSISEALGRNMSEVLHVVNQETREPVASPALRVLRDGAVAALPKHTVLISRDGSERSIADSCAPIRDAQGKTRGVVLVFRDVTEALKTELTLEQLRLERGAEARFRDLLEAAPDAMIIVGKGGDIALVNGQTERVFGYSRKELLGQPIEILVPERSRGAHPSDRDAYFTDPRPRPMGAQFDLCGRRKDGSEFPIEVSLSPLQADGATLVIAAIHDITERKVAETALKVANRELEAFSYSVAHDLRAPLRGMNGFAQVLLDTYRDKLDAEGRDWLQEILLNAKKMGELIDGLLSLARVTRSELTPENVDLSAIVREVVSHLRAAEPEREIDIEIQDGLHADVDVRLARVLLENLLGNAWKFTRYVPGARTEFGAIEKDGALAFFVRDNGAGFDMAFASKLFEPFQRLHSADEFPGTGIGLATVRRIIHRHGGRIWAEGVEYEGATFYFTFPVRTPGATK